MLRLWSMAGLAVQMRVLAGFLYVLHVGVTSLTSFVPGVVWRVSRNLINGRRTVMPILLETLGNHKAAHSPEDQERDDKEPGKSK